ncbi:hypothetical protein DZF98_03510 [Clavibacter californiensis]|uniref:Uncharacterized protein n=1 Tax=Clavibacter californiensis TaxID=1401995 RepID=A0ABX9N7Q1_9MICO|nr:hypothetical protein DZF98_03510 [Clavibacter californiensis]
MAATCSFGPWNHGTARNSAARVPEDSVPELVRVVHLELRGGQLDPDRHPGSAADLVGNRPRPGGSASWPVLESHAGGSCQEVSMFCSACDMARCEPHGRLVRTVAARGESTPISVTYLAARCE